MGFAAGTDPAEPPVFRACLVLGCEVGRWYHLETRVGTAGISGTPAWLGGRSLRPREVTALLRRLDVRKSLQQTVGVGDGDHFSSTSSLVP